ncbi:hypothetical protein QUF93_13805 [Bacillus hominis]|uniref:hypothetical protein n=1 Tax=Bacillus hominis TaxID=2817478 RepID=UPI0025A04F7C|nr:hypothetical protein [Bacillus hominis]MDM5193622.1 hypothetical protein [Bacillus hominis]
MDENKYRYKFEFSNAPKLDIRSEVAERNRMFEEAAKKALEANILMFKSFFDALASLSDIDWEEVDRPYKEAAESLAQKGWTIPMNMATNDIIKLGRIQDQYELDYIFQEFYKIEENYVYIKSAVLENRLTQEWRELIAQCFNSYENDNYLIVIPNLFIIIESLAHRLISQRFQKYINPNKKQRLHVRDQYKKVRKEIETDGTYIIRYISVLEFLCCVFKSGNFDKRTARLPIINRDWVLHGRDNPRHWKKVDALRLFNAIHTIIRLDFLLEDVEKEEFEAKSIK